MLEIPTDECGLLDRQGKDRGGVARAPFPPAFLAAVPDLIVDLDRASVELEFRLSAVGTGDGAVEDAARISQEVARLQRPGHRAEQEVTLAEVSAASRPSAPSQ